MAQQRNYQTCLKKLAEILTLASIEPVKMIVRIMSCEFCSGLLEPFRLCEWLQGRFDHNAIIKGVFPKKQGQAHLAIRLTESPQHEEQDCGQVQCETLTRKANEEHQEAKPSP